MMSPQEIAIPYPKIRANRDLDHLPGYYGPPLLGRTLETLSDSRRFVKRTATR